MIKVLGSTGFPVLRVPENRCACGCGMSLPPPLPRDVSTFARDFNKMLNERLGQRMSRIKRAACYAEYAARFQAAIVVNWGRRRFLRGHDAKLKSTLTQCEAIFAVLKRKPYLTKREITAQVEFWFWQDLSEIERDTILKRVALQAATSRAN